ncbi:BsuBI/PstI family type II restriction endonuclease, partial [Streptomyces sp. NPDC006984]|uniref:BsuBI/PstI family type II restriction endonuclease n=1 Tax=Streptomyces sp. NPDC006984 TaxID=3155463 RepID=UPI0033D9426B
GSVENSHHRRSQGTSSFPATSPPHINRWIRVEAASSHGPVDAKRHRELSELFRGSSAGLVFISALPSRAELRKYLKEIAWETDVWCADNPTHLIHFNGERFLGPYS